MQGRGSKPRSLWTCPGGSCVAPHAGAWIETLQESPLTSQAVTSPLMQGRGSKLPRMVVLSSSLPSPLMQGRGSKLRRVVAAPRRQPSPLMQGRGSKRRIGFATPPEGKSPLMQGRGSKHSKAGRGDGLERRPSCRGVDRNLGRDEVWSLHHRRPSCRGVDRNQDRVVARLPMNRRPSCRGVDRNYNLTRAVIDPGKSPLMQGRGSKPADGRPAAAARRRPSCRGVDRNTGSVACRWPGRVAPHAGAWIETLATAARSASCASPLMQGRGSKPAEGNPLMSDARRPSCRGVDRNCAAARSAVAWVSRPSCRGVDRNAGRLGQRRLAARRPSCRGVDRNTVPGVGMVMPTVAPHAGAWIETSAGSARR